MPGPGAGRHGGGPMLFRDRDSQRSVKRLGAANSSEPFTFQGLMCHEKRAQSDRALGNQKEDWPKSSGSQNKSMLSVKNEGGTERGV